MFLERAIHACVNCFFHTLRLLHWCLAYFCYECLFVTSAGMFKNELITWMYCWLVFCCHFFQFSTLAIACLFAFVIPAGVFLERAIHAFLRFQLFQPRSCVYYFGSSVFRASIFPFPLQLFQLLFRLASCFQNEPYMRSSVSFPTLPTAILYTFIISARVLNKWYGLTRPGTSLMRCSFTA